MSKVLEETSPGGTTPTSSASPSESKRREKTVPHYLRASTGSCHDLCKYGHKNPFEEELKFSGGRRKKLPTQLNSLALHRSAILDRSKDVRNRSLSLAKSSISLGEAERVAPKLTSANRKLVASNEHLVPRTATSTEQNNLNSDGRKKQSMIPEKAPTNLRCSNGVTKCDKKGVPAKGGMHSEKLKVQEKKVPQKSRSVDKVTTVKQSSVKHPVSSPTKLNTIKQGTITSQASRLHLPSSKEKSTPKGNVTSPSATINRVRAKPGRSPTGSSNAKTNGKEGSDISRSSFSMEPKLSTFAEIREDLHITGNTVESIPAQQSSDATESVGNSPPAPEESSTNKSNSDDDELGSIEKSEALAGGASLECDATLDDLPRESNDLPRESNDLPRESDPGHDLAEHNVMDGLALKDEDNQTDDASLCQLSVLLTTVENADVTQSNAKIKDEHISGSLSVEPLNVDGKEEIGVHEDIQRYPEILALDEKHAKEPEFSLDFASENAAENDKVNAVLGSGMDNCASQCQSISETSSDGELLKEPKSMLIEPSDSAAQIDALESLSTENIRLEGLKSRIIIPQSPEELSHDEFFEEYDFEFSESDESGTEDEEASVNKNRDVSLKAGDRRTRRITALELDDTNATPYKLKFKRGKILELPQDSSGPRRLKFRRKAANEVSNGQTQSTRRISKRNTAINAIPANPDVESSGVKLRHQDAQEKKDAQGLFNNVIEETASKLVESRKSKVKALVGAFETVISLQDGKPTSSTQQAGNSEDSVHDGEGNAPEEGQ